MTRDGRRIYFSSTRAGSLGRGDIFTSVRRSLTEDFEPPVPVEGDVNTAGSEDRFSVTPDGLTAFWSAYRPEGFGDIDIWTASRDSLTAPFLNVVLVTNVSTTLNDHDCILSPDGLVLLVARPAFGDDQDILAARRDSLELPFGLPTVISELSSNSSDADASMSEGGAVIVFVSSRENGVGELDLWYSVRQGDTYAEPRLIPSDGEVNTPENETEALISPDGCELFFTAHRDGASGGSDIYRAVFQSN